MATGFVSRIDVSNRPAQSSTETDVIVFKCDHKWTIKNFSHCWLEPGAVLHSRMFGCEPDDGVKWRLMLYPAGNDRINKDGLVLHLQLATSTYGGIAVKFKFWILNAKYEKTNLCENERPTTVWRENYVGRYSYVSRKYLDDENMELLPDGNLTIYCELTASAVIPITLTGTLGGVGNTEEDLIKLSYKWIIHDFSFRLEKTGQHVVSPEFFSPASRKIKWRLLLYPNGIETACRSYISLCIYPVSTNEEDIEVSYTFSLMNTKHGHEGFKSPITIDTFCDRNAGRNSCAKFFERRLLLDQENEWLNNDRLTILCEVAYSAKHRDDFVESDPTIPAVPACRLLDDLEMLFATKKLSDVTFVVGEKELQAHKTVLAARSSVFSAMFEHEMKEQTSNRVEITDMEYEVLDEMLRFIYTGKLSHVSDMATGLFKAADKYDLQRLKIIYERELCSKVTVENATDLFMLAHAHGAEHLKTAVIRFIAKERAAITKSEDFKAMTESHPQFICELLDRLSVLE